MTTRMRMRMTRLGTRRENGKIFLTWPAMEVACNDGVDP